jgi:hypothetical protein
VKHLFVRTKDWTAEDPGAYTCSRCGQVNPATSWDKFEELVNAELKGILAEMFEEMANDPIDPFFVMIPIDRPRRSFKLTGLKEA